MSNIIEMEESFVIEDNFKNLLKKIEEENFKFVDENIEEDTYYTDPDEVFVRDRICLRTRKTNDDKLELTILAWKYGEFVAEVNVGITNKCYNEECL